jgi:hypothetical protein
MTLDTRAYLNLSALAYIDFNKSLTGLTIKDLIERKAVPEKDLNSPELSVLQDPSSSRQILSDTNFKAVINFRSTFTNKTTSVLHHAYV